MADQGTSLQISLLLQDASDRLECHRSDCTSSEDEFPEGSYHAKETRHQVRLGPRSLSIPREYNMTESNKLLILRNRCKLR